jgi:excisionase family DNA binding protein
VRKNQVPERTEPKLLRMSEAAAVLGVSTFTIRNLIVSGRLPSVRFGPKGWHRIRRDDVERLVEEGL